MFQACSGGGSALDEQCGGNGGEERDRHDEDAHAKEYFGRAEQLARKYKIPRRFIYRQQEPGVVSDVWQVVHPRDTIIAAENAPEVKDVNPDRIRYELVPGGGGKVAHLLKRW